MKNVFVIIVSGLCIVNTLVFLIFFFSGKPDSNIADKRTKKVQKTVQVPKIIQEVNERNARITSVSCDDMKIKVWQNGMRFRLNGYFHYEKHDRFRMIFRSIFAKEIDLGSNDEIFWYWSRRNERPGIFYAKHEDYNKTRLKTPFNPIFMKHSLGFNEIKVKDANIVQTEKDVIVLKKLANSVGKPVIKAIFISKANKRIEAFLVTTSEGEAVASAEIQYEGDYPRRILYMWFIEKKALELNFTNLKINGAISEEEWIMPDYEPKIDMSED